MEYHVNAFSLRLLLVLENLEDTIHCVLRGTTIPVQATQARNKFEFSHTLHGAYGTGASQE